MIYSTLHKIQLRFNSLLGFNSAHIPKNLIKSITKNKNKPLIIDVGCNIGEFTQLIFKYNKKASVIAFDIDSNLGDLLNSKFSNFNFEYVNSGVSNFNGFEFVRSQKKYDRKAFLAKNGALNDKIQVIKLDNIIKKIGKRKINILKIDTEGNDFKVLQGAQKLLLRTEVVVFELMFRSLLNGNTPEDYLRYLKSKGFKHFYRSTKFFGLVEIQEIQPWEIMTQNIVSSRKIIDNYRFLV